MQFKSVHIFPYIWRISVYFKSSLLRITRVFDEEDVNQDIGDFLDGPVDTPYRTHNSSQVWSSD